MKNEILKKFQEFQENKNKKDFSLPDCLLTAAPYFDQKQWERIINYALEKDREFLKTARKYG